MQVQLTAAHWVYLAGIVVLIVAIVLRRNIVVPAILATLLTAWVATGTLLTGIESVFRSSLVAATSLFNIFLVIAVTTALLAALRAMKADEQMIRPIQKAMKNGHLAFLVLIVVTYVVSLFFWPSPAIALVGVLLIPAAIRAGLPPLGAAIAMVLAGQGMALSSDYVIRVAPGISAKAAGADAGVVADRALILSLLVGVTALTLTYVAIRKRIKAPSAANLAEWEALDVPIMAGGHDHGTPSATSLARPATDRPESAYAVAAPGAGGAAGVDTLVRTPTTPAGGTGVTTTDGGRVTDGEADGAPALHEAGGHGHTPLHGHEHGHSHGPASPTGTAPSRRAVQGIAIAVPAAFALLVMYMIVAKFSDAIPDIQGDDAVALVGGVALLLMIIAAFTGGVKTALESSAAHLTEGFTFAFRVLAGILPIAGFFLMGNGDLAASILGLQPGEAPSFLTDLVQAAQGSLPDNSFIGAFGVLLTGMIAGLEGSGFAGLPLTGALSGSLSPVVGLEPATLAAIGQMGSVWFAGTVVAWSGHVVIAAGFARVPVFSVIRRSVLPVLLGLVIATIVAVVAFG